MAVTGPAGTVAGLALGGRRLRVAIAALALAEAPVTAQRLAGLIWPIPPPTWSAALRGIVHELRTVGTTVGIPALVVTVPAGYALADDIAVDVRVARARLREADELLSTGRHQAALAAAQPVATMSGDALLPDEDGDWLAPHRHAVDELRRHALEVVVDAAGGQGDHRAATDAARTAVVVAPLDERAHRTLIRALDRAGDRAGVVAAFERCRAVLADELGVDPSRETVDAYIAALDDLPTGPAILPRPTTAFLGRDDEVAAVVSDLQRPGLVVVTGRGGVGKSRLAIEATRASVVGDRLWVPLGAAADDEVVASAVAVATGASPGVNDPVSAFTTHLASLGRALLVLDGCEAVVDGVSALVTAVVSACPAATVLATSRVPLAVPGAIVHEIRPLSTGEISARLLRARVTERGGEMPNDPGAEPLIAALCRLCAGVPLAVELVAAQLAEVSLDDLVADLSVGDLDGLRRVLARSHELLDSQEAAVFRRLAVLDGPAPLRLVRDVVGDDGVPPGRVARILHELAAQSMVTVDRTAVRWLYQQDDDLRRYAAARLADSGEVVATYERLGTALRTLLPADARAHPAPYREDVTAVLPSVRAFLAAAHDGRADREAGLELAFRLHRFWAATDVSEGRFWLARLIDTDRPSRWIGYAQFALGYLSYWAGDAGSATRYLEDSVVELRNTDQAYTAGALVYLGGLADDRNDGAGALRHLREALDITKRANLPDQRISAAFGIGAVLAERADPEAARHAADCIAHARARNATSALAQMLPNAAMVCWQVGAMDEARAYVAEALALHPEGSRSITRVLLLSAAAGVAYADGDPSTAADYARIADREGTDLGVERELPLVRTLYARALLDLGDIGGAASAAASAVRAARGLAFAYPLANCLETAVLVARAAGADESNALRQLLATATSLRAEGDRPGAPSLRVAVEAARREVGVADPPADAAAGDLALAMLARIPLPRTADARERR
jgi:predicted ATPase/DNA-binding SARP family transcriptional activator